MGGRGSASGIGAGASSGANGITQFPDKAKGSHSYGASGGSAQEAFFQQNSNYDELINQMDHDDISAFHAWTNGMFMDGQQYKGFSKMDEYEQELTRRYDNILDQATLDKGVMVVRRASPSLVFGSNWSDMFAALPSVEAKQQEFESMKGQTVKSIGNMSCGAASQGLTIGSYSAKNVEYRISIPKGSKGAGMWIGDSRINYWGREQREFMMNRDTLFKVGNTKYDSKRGVFVVDLEYSGREDHDYN